MVKLNQVMVAPLMVHHIKIQFSLLFLNSTVKNDSKYKVLAPDDIKIEDHVYEDPELDR